MKRLVKKMGKLIIVLVLFQMSAVFSAPEPRRSGINIFHNDFWTDLEKSMKELEKSYGDSKEELEEEDTDDQSTELEGWVAPDIMGFRARPWWQRKHVCQTKEIRNLPVSNFTTLFGDFESRTQVCTESNNKFTCTKTVQSNRQHSQTIINHECCDGYRLEKRRCVKYERYNLTVTASKVAPEFTEMLKATGILNQLENDEKTNYTIFVAANNALDELRENFEKINQIEVLRRRRSMPVESISEALKANLLNHVVNKSLSTNDLSNNEILETLSDGRLRFNVYPKSSGTIRTVNCKAIVKADQSALKGMVHVVDGVLKSEKNDIVEVLMKDNRFTRFMKFMEEAGLLDTLRTDNITVFAPTNEALAQGYGDFNGCNGVTGKHHIVSKVLCSAALDSREEVEVATMSGEALYFTHPADSPITIDGHAHITQADIMAANGVIHVLDVNLLPDAGKNISLKLQELNLTTFESLLMSSDVSEETGVTWFVPQQSAFDMHAEKVDELRKDPKMLRSFLLAHAIPDITPLELLTNGQQMQSRDNTELNFNSYSVFSPYGEVKRATVNCVPIRTTPIESCKARIYKISDLLLPPASSLMEILNDEHNDFSIITKVIQNAGMEDELTTMADEKVTFLAPTNDAFKKIPEGLRSQLLTNSTFAREVVLEHILPGVTCCHGIVRRSWLGSNYIQTKGKGQILMYSDGYGNIHIGPTEPSKCDLVARNGVIHAITSVLLDGRNSRNPFSNMDGVFAKLARNPNLEVLLFGL